MPLGRNGHGICCNLCGTVGITEVFTAVRANPISDVTIFRTSGLFCRMRSKYVVMASFDHINAAGNYRKINIIQIIVAYVTFFVSYGDICKSGRR